MADIPAVTGLGSSGSFTTALLKSLHACRKTLVDPEHLAEEACHIELDVLKEPIGKHDQYIAAYRGSPAWSSSRATGEGSAAAHLREDHLQLGGQLPLPLLHRLFPLGLGDPQGVGCITNLDMIAKHS